MLKPNKTKVDYDKQFSHKQYELNKQIMICNQMLENKESDEKIKATCNAIGEFCKEMLVILEKKHGTNHPKTMRDKNQQDANTYQDFLFFSKRLFINCLPNDQLNKKELDELLKPSISSLKEKKFSFILAKKLPDLKSEKLKTFKNKQDYVDYIKGKIKIYGADEIKTEKLCDLLGQWYSSLFELDYYVKKTLGRRKDDWGLVTTGLSLLNWYCNSNIYTKILLFAGGAMAPYISDAYYGWFHGDTNNQERELFRPSAQVVMLNDITVNAAINYLKNEIGKLQQQLNNIKSNGLTSEILGAINRGCGSLLTDKFSTNMPSFFGNPNVISQACGFYTVSKAIQGFTMHNS